MNGVWSTVSPQIKPVAGDDRTFPSVRYSACSVAYDGQLIVTHGYHYNHEDRHPAWKSDAWSFGFDTLSWKKIHEGERNGAPTARYSSTCVLWDHALYMYGGDDGGHKYSMNNYVFGAHFSEMWRFDLRSFTWQRVQYANNEPPKRALHAAVVLGNAMYVYGGLELADTWKFDFPTRKWELLSPPPTRKDSNHPGRRHALMAAAGDGCFYVFGGGQHGGGMRPRAFNDLFKFSLATNSWSRVDPVSQDLPGPRSHHSLLALSPKALLLYGGALCTPGCKCYGDVWLFDTERVQWSQLNTTSAPIHRYRQSLVVDERTGAIYLFGGESYRPYMYHNAVDKLELYGHKMSQLLGKPLPTPQALTKSSTAYASSAFAALGTASTGSSNSVLLMIALLAAFGLAARRCCKSSAVKYHSLDSI